MIIFPAVDIRHGRCVRLNQGRAEDETVFADDPVEMALRWQDEGAEWLHVIDLDGAFEGSPRNLPVVKRIAERTHIPVQMGGGIRTEDRVQQILELGVQRAIIGTAALKNPEFVETVCQRHGDRIAVSIDAQDGMVATEGWLEVSEKPAAEFGREIHRRGVRTIIYTDIQRDGMLTGPNIEAIQRFASAVDAGVIAAGGVATIEDIRALKACEASGVIGAVTGKAIYVGTLQLADAIEVAKT